MKINKFNEYLCENYDQMKNLDKAEEIINVVNFLKWVASDEQMDSKDENYCGFINIAMEYFDPSKDSKFKNRLESIALKKQFTSFLNLYRTDLTTCRQLMTSLGLKVEEKPDEEETILYSIL